MRMFPQVDTKDPKAVEKEVQSTYRSMFPEAHAGFVPRAFSWFKDSFEGRQSDYQPNDAKYHDMEHTLQGTLCMVRLLKGRHEAGVMPRLDQRMFELGLLAILLHDTGYLKRRGDSEGTGAKYTLIHVTRSVLFAEQLLTDKGIPIGDIRSVQHMIRCTGVNVDLERIPFQNELEKVTGFALGTADLLGQMAASDYVDKLPILFSEFEESARFYDGKMILTSTFADADDLIRKTPDFWSRYVVPKMRNEFWGMYKFLNQPYPDGPNEYVRRVEANVDRLRKSLSPVAVT